ncbi:DUF3300 domain-containing protein [Thalassotalea litorea]|uniref:DUF3300 domain-containing protein n=1 Tax=Thalassotalea litorea TaxID=2020715 RepID=A0A5R9IPM8_9GAMM|nr:DUF3300 domain-containing protein [Thalassotalea litorea]TLU67495.1 DUF3300 domain-containing protein [Thalassotalea litorea]
MTRFTQLLALLYLTSSASIVFAQQENNTARQISEPEPAQSSAPKKAQQANTEQIFSDAELEQMLAPIALYPDSLLTHILIASTYPLEVVQASRWRAENESLANDKAMKAAEDEDWDPSVKALIAFPEVLKRIADDLDWLQDLGDAFLDDESRLLASIQSLRQQADEAGSLSNMDKVEVYKEDNVIVIQSPEPEVIYVPYYDTRVVYGNWRWGYYPPVYWDWRWHHNHNRFAQVGYYTWLPGVSISFNYHFNSFYWPGYHMRVYNDYRYKPYHYRNQHYPGRRYHHKKPYYATKIKKDLGQQWKHDPKHRKGVGYRTDYAKKQYHSNRDAYVTPPTADMRKMGHVGGEQGAGRKELMRQKHQQLQQEVDAQAQIRDTGMNTTLSPANRSKTDATVNDTAQRLKYRNEDVAKRPVNKELIQSYQQRFEQQRRDLATTRNEQRTTTPATRSATEQINRSNNELSRQLQGRDRYQKVQDKLSRSSADYNQLREQKMRTGNATTPVRQTAPRSVTNSRVTQPSVSATRTVEPSRSATLPSRSVNQPSATSSRRSLTPASSPSVHTAPTTRTAPAMRSTTPARSTMQSTQMSTPRSTMRTPTRTIQSPPARVATPRASTPRVSTPRAPAQTTTRSAPPSSRQKQY